MLATWPGSKRCCPAFPIERKSQNDYNINSLAEISLCYTSWGGSMGEPVGRLGDNANVPACSHGCTSCAHNCTGPAVKGSPTVFVNSRPIVRETDTGTHAACCGPNTWVTAGFSSTVTANTLKVYRKGDRTTHCGGNGKLMEGSPDVTAGG